MKKGEKSGKTWEKNKGKHRKTLEHLWKKSENEHFRTWFFLRGTRLTIGWLKLQRNLRKPMPGIRRVGAVRPVTLTLGLWYKRAKHVCLTHSNNFQYMIV
jgi:hypothetical protein